jgi:hypothetical protein
MIAGVVVLAGCLSGQSRESGSALRRLDRQQPSAELTPQEVVRIQMEALKYNDDKNRGIEIVFRFASPNNKVITGPLSRFITMINGRAYRPMLNHSTVDYDRIRVVGDQAAQRLSLTTADGLIVEYVFVLSKQRGAECSGCWMTDAVFVETIQRINKSV